MALAVSLLLAATLALAGFAKLRDPDPFRQTVRSVLPDSAAEAVVRLLPPLELALATGLILGVAGRLVAALTLGLLLAFVGALLRVERQAERHAQPLVACNCFGSGADGDPAVGRVRNGLLALGAGVLIVWPAGPVWDVAPAQVAGALGAVVGAICLWQLGVALIAARRPVAA